MKSPLLSLLPTGQNGEDLFLFSPTSPIPLPHHLYMCLQLNPCTSGTGEAHTGLSTWDVFQPPWSEEKNHLHYLQKGIFLAHDQLDVHESFPFPSMSICIFFCFVECYIYIRFIKYYYQFHTTWKFSEDMLSLTIPVKQLLLIVLNSEYTVSLCAAALQSLNYHFK